MIPIPHERHVANVGHRAVGILDREVVQLLDDGGAGVEFHVVLHRPDFRGARGEDEVLRVDRRDDVVRRQAFGLQGAQVEIDVHDARLASVGPRQRRAFDGRQGDAHIVLRDVIDRLLGKLAAAESDLQDRDVRGIVANHQWRLHSGWHLAQHGLRDRRHLCHRRIHAGSRLEEYLDHAHAIVGLGFDVLDVVHRGGERALMHVNHALFHVFRVQARVLPDDADHRDLNGGKNVRRRPHHDHRHQEKEDQRGDDERVGPIEGEADDPHGGAEILR